MKSAIICCFLCILSLFTYAQLRLDQMPIYNNQPHYLTVTAEEQLIFSRNGGYVATADSIKGGWHGIPIIPDAYSFRDIIATQPGFFNRDTGFIALTQNDAISRTTNGGKNWQQLTLPANGYNAATFFLDNGEAWITITKKGIAYTTDYAKTWRLFQMPSISYANDLANKQGKLFANRGLISMFGVSYSALFFNKQKAGLAGAENMLACTRDNGITWTVLPTPLDNARYDKTDKDCPPSIKQVGIYGNYYLVKQEDLVFYSKKDTINWILLPGYQSFATDAENSALYLITEHDGIVKTGVNFEPLKIYTSQPGATGWSVKNGHLFFFVDGNIARLSSNDSLLFNTIKPVKQGNITTTTHLGIIRTPSFTNYFLNGDSLFTSPIQGGQSVLKGILPFKIKPTDHIQLASKDELALSLSADSVLFFNVATRKTRIKTFDNMLEQFTSKGIVSFSITRSNPSKITTESIDYKIQGAKYVLQKKKNSKESMRLDITDTTGVPLTLDSSKLNKWVRQLSARLHQPAIVSELEFTRQDYEQCKSDIRKFQKASPDSILLTHWQTFLFHKNNINYDSLLATVDRIKNMDTATLRKAAQMTYGMPVFNLEKDILSIAIENKAHEYISLNAPYINYRDFLFTWALTVEGATTSLIMPAINIFTSKTFPSVLHKSNKTALLHQLTRAMYLK